MARYTPEFLAAARHGYENTDQPMTALAADLGIGITTLQSLVRKHGWTQRSKRMRDSPPALRLLGEAQTLAAASSTLPPRSGGEGRHAPAGASRGGGPAQDEFKEPPTPDPSPPLATLVEGGEQSLSPVERLEALVVKELEAEEAMRAELALRPRTRHDAERCARTLSVLTQTLQTLQRMRTGGEGAGNSADYDDMPEDMDAFRNELARRINLFVESRMGKEWVDAERERAREHLEAMEAKREEAED